MLRYVLYCFQNHVVVVEADAALASLLLFTTFRCLLDLSLESSSIARIVADYWLEDFDGMLRSWGGGRSNKSYRVRYGRNDV